MLEAAEMRLEVAEMRLGGGSVRNSRTAARKPFARFRKNWELLALALPGIAFVVVFNYLPMYGLVLPFLKYDGSKGLLGGTWVGLQNFRYLFSGDAWRITRNTIVFNLIFVFLGLVCAVAFALMLYEMGKRSVKLYQTVLFVPFFVSWVVAAYIGLSVLDMQYGLLNKIIGFFGGGPKLWYITPRYWYFILPLANLWKGLGYGTLIYYTSLLGIDPDLYEAATLDGAKYMQKVRYISLPMIRHIIIMLTILAIGGMIRADFGLFFSFTINSRALYPVTDVIDTYVYRALRQLGNLGMSSAAGMYQSVVGFFLILSANWIVRKIDKDYALF
jgi:putative aldouronate transport system permease protein